MRRGFFTLAGLMLCSLLPAAAQVAAPAPQSSAASTDAIKQRDRAHMHAAHEVNGPMFAHAILTTDELLPQLG